MNTQKPIELHPDKNLIAFCGLYCGACRSYINGKCPGCKENLKASWCKIRTCCMENDKQSCAECELTNVNECKKFNNLVSKVFAFIFNSDRAACIKRIREAGYEKFAIEMSDKKVQSLKRKNS